MQQYGTLVDSENAAKSVFHYLLENSASIQPRLSPPKHLNKLKNVMVVIPGRAARQRGSQVYPDSSDEEEVLNEIKDELGILPAHGRTGPTKEANE